MQIGEDSHCVDGKVVAQIVADADAMAPTRHMNE